MVVRTDLESAGNEALRELGLTQWRIFAAIEEAETMLDRKPAADTCWNIQFNIVPGDGRFLTIRLWVRSDQVTDSFAVRENAKLALVNRIRTDHLYTRH